MTTDDIIDGYHTFGELYAHRSALFLCLLAEGATSQLMVYSIGYSLQHHPDDTPMYPGYLLAWIQTPAGMISYHLRTDPWLDMLRSWDFGIEYPTAPKWDGHTPEDVLNRIIAWADRISHDLR